MAEENKDLDITLINLGGYYLGITESPQQKWVELSTIQPVLQREFFELMESIPPHESMVIVEDSGQQHFMVELFTAYSLLLMSGLELARNVAKQLYIHYKVLDKLFFEAHIKDLVKAAKDTGVRITG